MFFRRRKDKDTNAAASEAKKTEPEKNLKPVVQPVVPQVDQGSKSGVSALSLKEKLQKTKEVIEMHSELDQKTNEEVTTSVWADRYLSGLIAMRDAARSHLEIDSWMAPIVKMVENDVIAFQENLSDIKEACEFRSTVHSLSLNQDALRVKILDLEKFLRGKGGNDLAITHFATFSKKMEEIEVCLANAKEEWEKLTAKRETHFANNHNIIDLKKGIDLRGIELERILAKAPSDIYRRDEFTRMFILLNKRSSERIGKLEDPSKGDDVCLKLVGEIFSEMEAKLTVPRRSFKQCEEARVRVQASIEAKRRMGLLPPAVDVSAQPLQRAPVPDHQNAPSQPAMSEEDRVRGQASEARKRAGLLPPPVVDTSVQPHAPIRDRQNSPPRSTMKVG